MNRRRWRTFILLFFDALIVMSSYGGALLARFDFSWSKIPNELRDAYLKFIPFGIAVAILLFLLCKMYSFVLSFVSIKECAVALLSVTAVNAINFSISFLMGSRLPMSVYLMAYLMQLVAVTGLRFSVRVLNSIKVSQRKNSYYVKTVNTMIIGAGSAGRIILNEISSSKYVDMKVCCFIDDNVHKCGRELGGIKIVGGRDKILEMVERYSIGIIVLAVPSISPKERKQILDVCKQTECQLRIVPGVYQVINGEVSMQKMRDVQIEDLLGRESIQVNLDEIMGYVKGRVILVTGGGGSIGSELCRQLASHGPGQLILFDIYENNAYDIQLELRRKYPDLHLEVLIGSVRDEAKIDQIFDKYRPNVVFHAAAHKHVPLMEDSPAEAIKNNVFGTFNVAKAASKYAAKKMVIISTDKAVNPTNVMGASKRLCEMVVQYFSRRSHTEFVAVRFGNVLGSNGSVIPVFKKQIESGGPVTVTHPDITRFFMTIPEAVSLVLQAGSYAKGGEIFVLDMGDPVRIDDLARNLIMLSGYTPDVDIQVAYTGLRPGEKLYEELLMDEEGMKKTPNSLIFIGSPIAMNDELFMEELKMLYKKCKENTEDIKDAVAHMVPTYKPDHKK